MPCWSMPEPLGILDSHCQHLEPGVGRARCPSKGNVFAFMPAEIGNELIRLQPWSPWLKLAQGKKKPRCNKKRCLKPCDQLSRSPCSSPSSSTNTDLPHSHSAQPSRAWLRLRVSRELFTIQIRDVFLHPLPIVSGCSSFLFGFREGKQLAKNAPRPNGPPASVPGSRSLPKLLLERYPESILGKAASLGSGRK